MDPTGRSRPDILVVGGGVIGLAIAMRARERGLSADLVADPAAPPASDVAAGMLAPVTEVHPGEEALLHLNLGAARDYPGWIEEVQRASGCDVGYRQVGTLMVARDSDENAALEEVWRLQRDLGLESERLRGTEVRELEPALSRRVRGGILVPGDHAVDAQALSAALRKACVGSGVRFRDGKVIALERGGGRVKGARLESGEQIEADTVVIAAGCWTGGIGGLPGEVAEAVRPVKGQLLHLRSRDEPPLLRRNLRSTEVYLVPRHDGRVVVGATVEEQGMDISVTAGAVYTLLRDAYELFPGIVEMRLLETRAGLRPGSRDNAPLIGRSGLEGLWMATGHYRNGILLAGLTARLLVEQMTSSGPSHSLDPFAPTRFTSAAAIS